MPNRVQTWLRTFRDRVKSRFNDTLFGSGGDSGSFAQGRSGRHYWIPGTELDWESLAGDLWTIPGVAVNLNWMNRNLLQAPPQVVTGEGENEKVVPDHPLIQLLRQPNDEYDLSVLIAGSLLSWECKGDLYIAIERAVRFGMPDTLWYIPHWMITPRRNKQTGKLYYEYRVRGQKIPIPREDMIHVRHGIDPLSPLEGLSPLASAHRDGYVLQQGPNYAAKAMRNGGIVGGIATPAEPKDPGTTYDFDPEGFMEMFRAHATGDKAGSLMAWNHPLNLLWPNVTPESMALDIMLDRPEATVSALIGIPPQVTGLHVGRLSKTYANQKEARESAWEEKLVPTGNTIYGQIGAHLLPQMSANAASERCCLDISKVRPLQPDKDALRKRLREDWMANLLDLAQWKKEAGYTPKPEDEGVYYKDVMVNQAADMAQLTADEDKQSDG